MKYIKALAVGVLCASLSLSASGLSTSDADNDKTGISTACCSGLLAGDTIATPAEGATVSTIGGIHKAGTIGLQSPIGNAVANSPSLPFETQLYAQNWAGTGSLKVPNGAKLMTVHIIGGGGGGSSAAGWGGNGGATCFAGVCVNGGQRGYASPAVFQVVGPAPGGNYGGGNNGYTGGGGGSGAAFPWGSTAKALNGSTIYPVAFSLNAANGNGGGGGGAGGYMYFYGGGGGGSGYFTSFQWAVTGGTVYNWSIGAGGAAGPVYIVSYPGAGGAGAINVLFQ